MAFNAMNEGMEHGHEKTVMELPSITIRISQWTAVKPHITHSLEHHRADGIALRPHPPHEATIANAHSSRAIIALHSSFARERLYAFLLCTTRVVGRKFQV